MTELLLRDHQAPVQSVDVDARTVTVRLVRWNDVRPVTDDGRTQYREAYAPGSLELADDIHVMDRHHGELIGRGDPTSLADTADGPTLELTLANTARGQDTLALLDAGVIRSVSLEVEPLTQRSVDGVVWRTGRVHGVAFAFRPQHDAPVLATRSDPDPDPTTTTTESDDPMTDTQTTPTVDTTPDPTPAFATVDVLERSLDELRDDMARIGVGQPASDTASSQLLQYRSLGEYAEALWHAPDDQLLRRALADQVTTDNPGVVPPGWLTEVAGIVNGGTPTISAFGRQGLPATGMDVNWPYFDGDLSTLIAQQMTEKSAINSVLVSLEKGTAPILTFAGGSDVSYQLIRRSDPAYLAQYLRIMAAAMALTTDSFAASAAAASAVASSATFDPATDDLGALGAAVFAASVEVQAATGIPAQFALAASDMFVTVGGLTAAASQPYGTNNVAGTGSAASLSVSVGGIPVVHVPSLAAGTLLVSNSSAGGYYADGPFTVTAEDVEKLGQNVAVFEMGAMVISSANGVRAIGAN